MINVVLQGTKHNTNYENLVSDKVEKRMFEIFFYGASRPSQSFERNVSFKLIDVELRRRPETPIIIFLRTFDAWGGGGGQNARTQKINYRYFNK